MLSVENAILIVIDIQGNLAHTVVDRESLFANTRKLIEGARVFDLPLLVTEQIPAKLGPTIPEIAGLLPGIRPIAKESFSCLRNGEFLQALRQAGRRQILLAGIETHICVYQTARELLEADYSVFVVADAVSSRAARNSEIGLQLIRGAGGTITSTETVLFELLGTAAHEKFKDIFKIVK